MKKFILIVIVLVLSIVNSQLSLAANNEEKKIEKKYLPMFETIESEAVTRLNLLIDEAYIEYEKKKENGEITLPLLFSYIEKGKNLEDEIEEAFQTVLAQLKEEIKQKGLPQELAYPYENQYVKSKRKNKLAILKNITLEGHTISFDQEK